ncbi:MAG: hypothetical protein LBE17_09990 [Treponema sp.]|nr:hypothetical protein [Treponema sp.]
MLQKIPKIPLTRDEEAILHAIINETIRRTLTKTHLLPWELGTLRA